MMTFQGTKILQHMYPMQALYIYSSTLFVSLLSCVNNLNNLHTMIRATYNVQLQWTII